MCAEPTIPERHRCGCIGRCTGGLYGHASLDRGFQKGDVLELIFHDPVERWRTRDPIRKRVSYVLTGGQLGIEPGYVVLGLSDEDS